MKSVGIIGGLGPETTAQFYLEVIFQCQKQNQTQRPSIVISSVPLPFDIERDLIQSNTGTERYLPFLTAEAKRLETSGVDFLVMPCNSLHVFIDELRESVGIPIISIVEETTRYIKDKDYKNIGLISTAATVANRVYEKQFEQNDLEYRTPDESEARQVNSIIQRLVEGAHLDDDRTYLESIVERLETLEVDSVALACTDLQLLLPIKSSVPVFDTMKILAVSTAQTILSSN